MAHGDAREGKWRGNWWMEWIASTPHPTSELGVSSITTADAHTSAASSRPNWRPRRCKWTRPFRRKTKSGFCACAITFQTQSNNVRGTLDNQIQNTNINISMKFVRLAVFLSSCRKTGTYYAKPVRHNHFFSLNIAAGKQQILCLRWGHKPQWEISLISQGWLHVTQKNKREEQAERNIYQGKKI
jgi:hypothetical protein